MKREFLKNLGIEGDIAEQIMAEHGKTVEKFKSDSKKAQEKAVVSEIIRNSGARSEELLARLIDDCHPDSAKNQVDLLKSSHPWLFKQSLPVFSASCEEESLQFSPFRYGAGL